MAFRLETQAEPIPGYRLIERLGAGGFGEVWKAEAPGGLLKAIKFVYGDLKEDDQDGVIRAEQELKALGRIKSVRHPYILSLERFDIVDGQLIVVMELADRSVWDRYRECRSQNLPGIPREELLCYLEEAAEALDLMNSQHQLQHLDIKPQNLFLVYNHVKVADFGLVKALASTSASVTGGVTPVYAAPEMFDGRVSRFCDQYSLGIVYQELLTGQRPFSANNVHQLIMQHVQGQPNLTPLPESDRPIIGRALSKTPEQRFPTCVELIRALRHQPAVQPATLAEVNNPYAPTEPHTPAKPARSFTPVAAPSSTGPSASATPAPAEDAPAKEEIVGNGELFPALLIGLGQTGLEVLQALHGALVARFGSRQAVPHIRLLYLDTDPDALHAASQGGRIADLPPEDVLAARLNRPSHYLKHREGRPAIDTWCNSAVLYRIGRSQRTEGLRILGRLAFLDNYRAIAQRVQKEVQTCADPNALTAARQATGLELRSNRPRVWVVAGLGGGTGGGMVIDLGYALRPLLRGLGYPDAETTGLLLLPPRTKGPGQATALGNAFAALTELNYFSAPETTYSARYDTRETTVTDANPPFSRCALAQLPEAAKDRAALMERLGQALCLELTTPLGRAADTERQQRLAQAEAPSDGSLRVSSIGLARLCWDRRTAMRQAAARFCQQVLKHWITKDTKPVQAAVQALVQEQWTRLELAADFMIARLQTACEKLLGTAPENKLTEITNPLMSSQRRLSPQAAAAATEALNQIDLLVGQPSASSVLGRPGTLEDTMQKEADALVVEYGRNLAKVTLPLVEHPAYRLAGAEEAVHQLIGRIEQLLQHQEPLSKELSDKATKGYDQLRLLVSNLSEIVNGGRRAAPFVTKLHELLKFYPKWRYQSLQLRRVCLAYTSLRGFLADQLREIAFCRVRLTELSQQFDAQIAGCDPAPAAPGVAVLYPPGCADLNAVVERLVAGTTPEDLVEFDQQLQEMVQQQFHGLIHVCTTSANLLKNLQDAMLTEGEAFAATRLAGDDVVEMFLDRYPSEEEASAGLAAAMRVAEPSFVGLSASEDTQFTILAAPASPYRERLLALGPQVATVLSPDDIIIYREETDVLLSDLDHLGPAGRSAYEQLCTAENVSPHCRTDITAWQPTAAERASQ